MGVNLVNRDLMKDQILSVTSVKIGGEVKYKDAHITLFHRPHLVLEGGHVNIPGKLDADFDTLDIYPAILPLFLGNIEVSELRVIRPNIVLSSAKKSDTEKQKAKQDKEPILSRVRSKIKNIFEFVKHDTGDLNIQIVDGEFELVRSGNDLLKITQINALFSKPQEKIQYKITATSDEWDRISAQGWLSPDDFESTGKIDVTGLKVGPITPGTKEISTSIAIEDADLSITYDTGGLNNLDVYMKTDIPKILLDNGENSKQIENIDLASRLSADDNEIKVEVLNGNFTTPPLSVNGSYRIDNNTQSHELTLSGQNIDAKSARDIALFVAGQNRIVKIIFEIVRGGTVPDIKLTGNAGSFKQIWKKGNFELKGSMINGEVFIPKAEYDLTDAKGEVVIGDGLLKGSNMSAKMGNSIGTEGSLTLGLEGPIGPLLLDVLVDADVSDIPPVLKQFISDRIFQGEIDRLQAVSGRAKGKLILGEQKKSPKPKIDVTDLTINADYGRVPYKLEIDGGRFQYENKFIKVSDINLTTTNFSTKGINGSFSWQENNILNLNSSAVNFELHDMFKWLRSFDLLGSHLEKVADLKGSALLDSLAFKGDVMVPSTWRIESVGSINNAVIKLPGLDGDITVPSNQFVVTPEKISFNDSQIQVDTNSINLGANINNYVTHGFSVDVKFNGGLDAPISNELITYFNIPDLVSVTGPLSISDSSLVYKKYKDNNSLLNGAAIKGTRTTDLRSLKLDITLDADSLEWKKDKTYSENTEAKTDNTKEARPSADPDARKTLLFGDVKVKSKNFAYGQFDWTSVDGVIDLDGRDVNVNISSANLCGIDTPGVFEVSPPKLKLDLTPKSTDTDLSTTIECLLKKGKILTGDFKFDGDLLSDTDQGAVFEGLNGNLDFISHNGHVSNYGTVAKFFSILNLGDVIRGELPDFSKKGFPYEMMKAKGEITDGILELKEAVMDGRALKVVCEGTVDLVQKQLDLQVLVIPVFSVDAVIEKIPLVKSVLGKDMVSIPVRVSGDISNPEIKQLSVSAISTGILAIIKETLNIPVSLVKPLPKHDDAKDD